MNDDVVLDKLTLIFRDVFFEPDLVARPDMTADEVERWDSLFHIDMIVLVEEEFGIRFQTSEVNRMDNVGDLVKLIQAKVG